MWLAACLGGFGMLLILVPLEDTSTLQFAVGCQLGATVLLVVWYRHQRATGAHAVHAPPASKAVTWLGNAAFVSLVGGQIGGLLLGNLGLAIGGLAGFLILLAAGSLYSKLRE